MEMPGVFFMVGDYPTCPKCVRSSLNREEVTLSEAAGYTIRAAKPGLRCRRCGLPVAREACEKAFEHVITALDAYIRENAPPCAETTPEDEEVAKADAEVIRAKAAVGAAYRELAAARNRIIAKGGRLSDEPVLPE